MPCVFLTHQLKVLSGATTWLSSKIHQNIISKFNECWVPDYAGSNNISGDLGHTKTSNSTLKYIGPLSRFEKQNHSSKYNILVLLSGPEPQRGYLETILLDELKLYDGKILFVKGTVENEQIIVVKNNITIYNFMTSTHLNTALNESDLVVSRSGYTTIMDLAKLEKKAFFIPTPGQFEQEYLAKKFKQEGIAYSCKQDDFKIELLAETKHYFGFKPYHFERDFKDLFSLF
ncbi:glycosyltransferase [uncultured Winogradskyella sp.]|uniref:glycosyltransferase n=1 Tax=uncultured Winogradskyella sp. TaxID=395353 RepID=UPI0030DB7E6B